MNTTNLNYHPPTNLIAQELAHPRDHCKLMVVKDSIEHKHFYNLPDHLKPGDVLVVNQTKVQHAKLLGKKQTGAKVEVILTKQHQLNKPHQPANQHQTIEPHQQNTYDCRIKGTNVRVNSRLIFPSTTALVTAKNNDIFTIIFEHPPAKEDLILPTPPYVKKPIPEIDYQTIFAKDAGSLAAPTAALHFTPELVAKLLRRGIKFAPITLHIGFGTFLPVRDISTYKTEPEYFEIPQSSADIINNATRIIPMGTTSIKTLESSAKNGKIHPISGFSDIFIHPGYRFKLNLPAMITNFHLPNSSLLMLVAAFAGTERILNAYNEAIKKEYRFYSLGDAMLLFR